MLGELVGSVLKGLLVSKFFSIPCLYFLGEGGGRIIYVGIKIFHLKIVFATAP